jgi:thiosulfate dehydrogenase
MKFLRSSWFPLLLGIIAVVTISSELFTSRSTALVQNVHYSIFNEDALWQPPSEDEIPAGQEGDLIRYGRDLIANTSIYLGPKGVVGHFSNNTNCQNCHIGAGTQNFCNPFSAVASTYPKYRERSGREESIEFRINDCMQRSLNGAPLDSLSTEMRAMVAYVKWVGKDVPKGFKPKGAGTGALPYLKRAADPNKGKAVYYNFCQRCHGQNGEGLLTADSSGYTYPPLWGDHSFNVGAGLYRLSYLAGFIKNNMPFGTTWQNPVLSNEEAWDVAAYIASQPRPVKVFAHDWANVAKKPVDYPFGPYADSFSETQHKYGPFGEMKK